MSTEQKVVFVTGCSKGGIGYALCEEYANRGCKVYATARRLESMDTLQHPNIQKLSLDILSDKQVTSVVETIIQNEGKIDMLVNNAGVGCPGPAADVPLDIVRDTFESNVFAVVRTYQAVFPHMAARKSGTIVNFGSIVGEFTTAWNGIYAASKAAVHRICDAIYQECKPFNINVVCVAPGAVKTNIAQSQTKDGINVSEKGFYKPWTDVILNRIYQSQGPNSISPQEMAKAVAAATLSSSPPRYFTKGGHSTKFQIIAWLPKTFVLDTMWNMCKGNVQVP